MRTTNDNTGLNDFDGQPNNTPTPSNNRKENTNPKDKNNMKRREDKGKNNNNNNFLGFLYKISSKSDL